MYSVYIDGFKSLNMTWSEMVNFIRNYTIENVNSIITELTNENITLFNTKYNNNVIVVKA